MTHGFATLEMPIFIICIENQLGYLNNGRNKCQEISHERRIKWMVVNNTKDK